METILIGIIVILVLWIIIDWIGDKEDALQMEYEHRIQVLQNEIRDFKRDQCQKIIDEANSRYEERRQQWLHEAWEENAKLKKELKKKNDLNKEI